jgi:LacI family transcriptional regulator, repressor for deo operon, udp, cdd, tsx, nupC, and nupG
MSRSSWKKVKEVRIADVAQLAGVSTATVSRVLASPDQVRPKTHKVVMEAVRRSGYTPNSTARNLRTRRTMNVLVVAPRLTNPVFAQVLRGVDDELTQSGYGIIVANLDNQTEREVRYVDLVLSRQVDGVLLMNGRIPQNSKRSMADAGLPMVAMCSAVPGGVIPNIVVQDREASRKAAEYLVQLGHRSFGYISGLPGTYIETERFNGFLEGLKAAGCSSDVVRWEGPFMFSTGVSAAKSFLRTKKRLTGIFAACDESAIGFIKTVRSAGIRVPEDVSVIGFDGIEFADYTEPTLTTFKQPLHEIGRIGAATLLKMIQGEKGPKDRDVRLPLQLLERGTTGSAPDMARG